MIFSLIWYVTINGGHQPVQHYFTWVVFLGTYFLGSLLTGKTNIETCIEYLKHHYIVMELSRVIVNLDYTFFRYGRRTSFFLLLTIEIFLSIVACFSPNYVVFTVIRTLNGFTFPALFQIPFILCLEVMGPAYRTFAGMMICLFFAVALMLLAGLAYIFNSWFSLAIVTSVPFVSLFR